MIQAQLTLMSQKRSRSLGPSGQRVSIKWLWLYKVWLIDNTLLSIDCNTLKPGFFILPFGSYEESKSKFLSLAATAP